MKKGYIIQSINPNIGVYKEDGPIRFVGYDYTIYPDYDIAEAHIPEALEWTTEALTISIIYYT